MSQALLLGLKQFSVFKHNFTWQTISRSLSLTLKRKTLKLKSPFWLPKPVCTKFDAHRVSLKVVIKGWSFKVLESFKFKAYLEEVKSSSLSFDKIFCNYDLLSRSASGDSPVKQTGQSVHRNSWVENSISNADFRWRSDFCFSELAPCTIIYVKHVMWRLIRVYTLWPTIFLQHPRED